MLTCLGAAWGTELRLPQVRWSELVEVQAVLLRLPGWAFQVQPDTKGEKLRGR